MHKPNQKNRPKPSSNKDTFIQAKGQDSFFGANKGTQTPFFPPKPKSKKKGTFIKDIEGQEQENGMANNLVGLPSKENSAGDPPQNDGNQQVAQCKVFFKEERTQEAPWYNPLGADQVIVDFRPMTEQELMNALNHQYLNQQFGDIIFAQNEEYEFIQGATPEERINYRRQLITDIIYGMYCSEKPLYYDSWQEIVSDIRKRAITSLDMRVTQGRSPSERPTGYPASCPTGAQVNEFAQPFWTVYAKNKLFDYHFELTPEGRQNGYKALEHLLFIHQREACLRSLMHCDHMVSAIHYKAMADAMGIAQFNQKVAYGQINLTLTPTAFYENNTYDKGSGKTETKNKSLQRVSLNSYQDLIIGDHVVFYNHDAYGALSLYLPHASWRLENAIVTDIQNGEFRFQGHGFFSPKTLPFFVGEMMGQFNDILEDTRKEFKKYNMNERTSKAKFARSFPSIKFKGGANIDNAYIQYKLGNIAGCPSSVKYWPLRKNAELTDYPKPLSMTCNHKIVVYRPIESIKEPIQK